MTPEISSALAVLIGTLSTVLLMAGAYYFGPQKRAERDDKREAEAND